MSIDPRHAELLAPAGCFPSLAAGIAAGANSVYFGLAQLNMRARARRSFEISDLEEITARCHTAGVKAYLTLNTLLYDHDLPAAARLLDAAAAHKVDAVILADLAALELAHQRGLEVHLSTQLSVSNFQSLKFFAPLVDRIVLARELNLAQIRHIHERILAEGLRGRSGRILEIEAFAHGALCVAVSGRCGMSLFTSNASANRGACEQNCRKEYIVTDAETGQQLKVDNHFIMSPNDIATIEFLDQLLEAGVHTLKLEGRGRSPEYVATVTKAYRAALDALAAGLYSPAFVQSLLGSLSEVYNRGLSSGYYLGRKQGWSAAAGSKATTRKVFVGDLVHVYDKPGVCEVRATASAIRSGDAYLIIGHTTGVSEGLMGPLRVHDGDSHHDVEQASPGQTFTFKHAAKVRPGDKLYKIAPVGTPGKAPSPRSFAD